MKKLIAVLFVIMMASTNISIALSTELKSESTIQSEIDSKTQTIVCRPNEKVEIILEENPSTGYVWEFQNASEVKIISDEFIQKDTKLVGAPGKHKWVFEVQMPGNYNLKFSKSRPWENQIEESKTFNLECKIPEKFETDKVKINGTSYKLDKSVEVYKNEILFPFREIAQKMGAQKISWDQEKSKLSLEIPSYSSGRLYNSYLSGIKDKRQDGNYKLPERVSQIGLPNTLFSRRVDNSISKTPITIAIKGIKEDMEYAVYDYVIKNGTMYFSKDTFNELFFSNANIKDLNVEFSYYNANIFKDKIKEIDEILKPVSEEELLSLWIKGQQIRSGALQYTCLSKELKNEVVKERDSWVTGGSTPSAGMATISKREEITKDEIRYSIKLDEMAQGKVIGQSNQIIEIKKQEIDGKVYYEIIKASGDLGYFTILN